MCSKHVTEIVYACITLTVSVHFLLQWPVADHTTSAKKHFHISWTHFKSFKWLFSPLLSITSSLTIMIKSCLMMGFQNLWTAETQVIFLIRGIKSMTLSFILQRLNNIHLNCHINLTKRLGFLSSSVHRLETRGNKGQYKADSTDAYNKTLLIMCSTPFISSIFCKIQVQHLNAAKPVDFSPRVPKTNYFD